MINYQCVGIFSKVPCVLSWFMSLWLVYIIGGFVFFGLQLKSTPLPKYISLPLLGRCLWIRSRCCPPSRDNSAWWCLAGLVRFTPKIIERIKSSREPHVEISKWRLAIAECSVGQLRKTPRARAREHKQRYQI